MGARGGGQEGNRKGRTANGGFRGGGGGGAEPPDVGQNLEKCSKISIRKLNFNKKILIRKN